MSSKSSSLNLWDVETKEYKMDIDVHTDRVNVAVTGSQSLVINPPLKLIDAVGGDIASVSTKIHSIDAAIAAANAGSALVQQNLDAFETSSNAAHATLIATVVSNKSISDQAQVSDSDARTLLQNTLQTAVDDEESARISADDVLTASLATEITNRTTAVSAEATARSSAVTNLQSQIDTEKTRVDAILNGSDVNLDQFAEVVANYNSLNTDALAQIAALNTLIVNLTNRVDDLTNP